ncbi:MAG: patatin-like phospholipase family protein [Clostridium sp.]|jgi:NTE family protein|nr:patatin-like phospholipase family protein [Clostridium sp.]
MAIHQTRIGLALSGGGIRAALFHFGVLRFLAERKCLENISCVSTVSGAGLGVSLILAKNNFLWPSSEAFVESVLPPAMETVLGRDLQETLRRLYRLQPDVGLDILLAKALEAEWGIRASLQDVDPALCWVINAVTFETGGNFRFTRQYMGEAQLGYALRPDFPVSTAVAVSAAYPLPLVSDFPSIGPHTLDMRPYQWHKEPVPGGNRPDGNCRPRSFCHLWDGGVYDNLGLEALYADGSLLRGLDFLIVSDASKPLTECVYTDGEPSQNEARVWDISADRLNRTLIRDLLCNVTGKGKGAYIRIGKPAAYYPTTLAAPSKEAAAMLVQNGYESAQKALRTDQRMMAWSSCRS